MSNNPKNLFYELFNANSDYKITRIIKNNSTLRDLANWHPYGDIKNNLGTINNQQQSPVAALTEKIINSIDAMLIKECCVRGIDPEDINKAPRSMEDALEKFFGIPKGDFSETTSNRRRELANNIKVLAVGDKQTPCIVILDNGEGQSYKVFKNTFLSLHKNNKVKIPFVQGKFNMGGTGVLRFCGENRYQLVLSKKPQDLLKDDKDDKWGFTLIRLRPEVSKSDKHSWYEYCVDKDGGIFSFDANDLLLFSKIAPLESGSLVKMYDYQLPPGTRSNITLDLWRELNRNLYLSALPALLYDLRFTKGHVTSGKILLGNKTRILVDENEKVELTSIIEDVDFQKAGLLNIEYTVFKADALKTKDEFTSDKKAIFFTVNGQTHATLPRSFIKSKVRLPYVAQSLLVHVDCTNMSPIVRDKIFMASRDRMAESKSSEILMEVLARELKEDEGLQTINKTRHEKILSSNPKETRFMEEVVSELIKNDRDLVNLLGLRGKVKDITDPGPVIIPKFKGKEFPTFFKLLNKEVKRIPKNSYVRVRFQTDVSNDYFQRANNPGSLRFTPPISTSKHLFNGFITTKLIPRKGVKLGEKEKILVELIRPYDEPLKEVVNVEYIGPIQKQANPPGPPSKPKGKEYGLPKHNLIKREGWGSLGWGGKDIAEVVPYVRGVDNESKNNKIEININQEPDVLQHYLRVRKLSSIKADIIKNRYYTSILLYSLVVHNHFSKLGKKDLLSEVMKSISKIILNLLFSGKFLKELETV